MPDPIDFDEIEVGFGNQVRRTDIVSGWPMSDEGGISKFSGVQTGEQSTLVDGMIVGVDATGKFYRKTTTPLTTVYDIVDSVDTVLTINGANSTLKIDNGSALNFADAGINVGDIITIISPILATTTVYKQSFSVKTVATVTLTFDNLVTPLLKPDGTAYTAGNDGDFNTDFEGTALLVLPVIDVADAVGTVLVLAGAASTLKIESAGGVIDFVASGLRVGDFISLNPVGAVTAQRIQITGFTNDTTIQFDNIVAKLKASGGSAYADASPVAAFPTEYEFAALKRAFSDHFFAIEPYKTFGGTVNQESKKITVLADNCEYTTAELVDPLATLKANTHPILAPILIAAAGTDMVITGAGGPTTTMTVNSVDFEDLGVRPGDTFTITPPAGKVEEVQGFKVLAVSTTTITFDNLVPSTGIGSFSKCDGAGANDGTAYDNTSDTNFGTDADNFLGGLLTFNRARADFTPGDGVGTQLGKLSVLSSGAEQVVGFVISTDVLHRAVAVSHFPASKYRGV